MYFSVISVEVNVYERLEAEADEICNKLSSMVHSTPYSIFIAINALSTLRSLLSVTRIRFYISFSPLVLANALSCIHIARTALWISYNVAPKTGDRVEEVREVQKMLEECIHKLDEIYSTIINSIKVKDFMDEKICPKCGKRFTSVVRKKINNKQYVYVLHDFREGGRRREKMCYVGPVKKCDDPIKCLTELNSIASALVKDIDKVNVGTDAYLKFVVLTNALLSKLSSKLLSA